MNYKQVMRGDNSRRISDARGDILIFECWKSDFENDNMPELVNSEYGEIVKSLAVMGKTYSINQLKKIVRALCEYSNLRVRTDVHTVYEKNYIDIALYDDNVNPNIRSWSKSAFVGEVGFRVKPNLEVIQNAIIEGTDALEYNYDRDDKPIR